MPIAPTGFVFFTGDNGPLSMWHPCNIELDGVHFNSALQVVAYRKAKLFEDNDTAQHILKEMDPQRVHDLSHQVKSFSSGRWFLESYDIFDRANQAKFSQNPHLLEHLLSDDYTGKEFVETLPCSLSWGIGLTRTDPRANHQAKWLGENMLGKILTELREQLSPSSDAPGTHSRL